jgi:hypothetical protein
MEEKKWNLIQYWRGIWVLPLVNWEFIFCDGRLLVWYYTTTRRS